MTRMPARRTSHITRGCHTVECSSKPVVVCVCVCVCVCSARLTDPTPYSPARVYFLDTLFCVLIICILSISQGSAFNRTRCLSLTLPSTPSNQLSLAPTRSHSLLWITHGSQLCRCRMMSILSFFASCLACLARWSRPRHTDGVGARTRRGQLSAWILKPLLRVYARSTLWTRLCSARPSVSSLTRAVSSRNFDGDSVAHRRLGFPYPGGMQSPSAPSGYHRSCMCQASTAVGSVVMMWWTTKTMAALLLLLLLLLILVVEATVPAQRVPTSQLPLMQTRHHTTLPPGKWQAKQNRIKSKRTSRRNLRSSFRVARPSPSRSRRRRTLPMRTTMPCRSSPGSQCHSRREGRWHHHRLRHRPPSSARKTLRSHRHPPQHLRLPPCHPVLTRRTWRWMMEARRRAKATAHSLRQPRRYVDVTLLSARTKHCQVFQSFFFTEYFSLYL